MAQLSDRAIRYLLSIGQLVIKPFSDHVSVKGSTSYGLSNASYDLTLSAKIKVRQRSLFGRLWDYFFTEPIDLKNIKDDHFAELIIPEEGYVMKPNEKILGISNEYIQLPANVSGLCMQKSTLARVFLHVAVTPLQPTWAGYLVLEIHNTNDRCVRIHKNMGICGISFHTLDQPVDLEYGKIGKYDEQPAGFPVTAK